jgi:hypothetical protein
MGAYGKVKKMYKIRLLSQEVRFMMWVIYETICFDYLGLIPKRNILILFQNFKVKKHGCGYMIFIKTG